MPKFEITVPYRETVHGVTTYRLEADSKEKAIEMLQESDGYLYYYDQEADHSEHYEEFWDDAEWEELT